MAISLDRIHELAIQKAQEKREVPKRAREPVGATGTELGKFRRRLPVLTARAFKQHDARFQPLREILEDLNEPLALYRDRFFPEGSRIFYLERYQRLWNEFGNSYSTNLMFYESEVAKNLIAVSVNGDDKLRRSDRIRKGIPQYISIDIAEGNLWKSALGDVSGIDLPPYEGQMPSVDFQNTTRSDLLLQPDFQSFSFESRQGTVLSDLEDYRMGIPYMENGKILALSVHQSIEQGLAWILSRQPGFK